MASTRCASSLRDNRWRPWAARHRNGTRADRSTPVPWLTPQCMTRHRPPARPPARRARYGRTPHAPWRFWPCGLQDVSARVASHSPAATGRTGGPPFRRPIRRRRADQAARTPRRQHGTRDRPHHRRHDDPRRCDGKRPTTERDDPHHARARNAKGRNSDATASTVTTASSTRTPIPKTPAADRPCQTVDRPYHDTERNAWPAWRTRKHPERRSWRITAPSHHRTADATTFPKHGAPR